MHAVHSSELCKLCTDSSILDFGCIPNLQQLSVPFLRISTHPMKRNFEMPHNLQSRQSLLVRRFFLQGVNYPADETTKATQGVQEAR